VPVAVVAEEHFIETGHRVADRERLMR